nr:hypothetical protein GCM10025732_10860 [Glycomyces mayteni]
MADHRPGLHLDRRVPRRRHRRDRAPHRPRDAEIDSPTDWYSVDDADALPDGRYEVVYAITADSGFTFTAPPCGLYVDTSDPEFLGYEVAPGQHYVGDTVAIEVTATDTGFPDGANWLRIGCAAGNFDPARGEVVLSSATTGTCELVPPASDPWLSFWMYDAAGNEASMPTPGLQATWSRNDYNGDGHQDLMTVRRSDGNLVFHAGKGDGTFAPGVAKGAGWGGFDLVMAGDLNGDDRPDVLGRNSATGALYLYPGNGSGGLGTRVQIGTGWSAMGAFTASGDFDHDGNIDLVAVKPSTGSLYLYPGKGDGTFGAAAYVKSQIAYDWSRADTITTPGDVDGDGYDDLLAHDDRTGVYYLYFNNGGSQFHSRATVPASLDGTGTDRYTQVVGAGDVDGDNYEDLLAVDSRTGELELHSLAEDGTALHQGRTVATAWGGQRLSAVGDDRAYDFDGSGASDLAARRSSTGTTYLYTGTGTGVSSPARPSAPACPA